MPECDIKEETKRHFSQQWRMFSTYKDLGYGSIQDVAGTLLKKTNTTPEDWKGKKCFDGGCGIGIYSLAALELGAESVVAVDIAEGAVETCKKNTEGNPVRAYVADLTSIPEPDESFDAAFSVNCLQHIHNVEKAIKELARITKPNGWVAFSIAVKRPESLIKVDEEIRGYTRRMCPKCLMLFSHIITFLDSIPEIQSFLVGKVELTDKLANAYDHYGLPYTKGYSKDEVTGMAGEAGLRVERIDCFNQTFCRRR